MLNWLNGWQRIGVALTGLWLLLVFGSGVNGYLSLETGGGAFVRTIVTVPTSAPPVATSPTPASDPIDQMLAARAASGSAPSKSVPPKLLDLTQDFPQAPNNPFRVDAAQATVAPPSTQTASVPAADPSMIDLAQGVPEAPDNPFRAQMAADQAMNGIPQAPDRHEFQFDDMVVVALVPPLLAWLLIYGAVATVRWIAKGFRRKLG